MSRVAVRPYLVAKDAEGKVRVTVRGTRFNSQGYPLVTTRLLDDVFPTATAAKAYVREQFGATSDQIASK